MTKINNNQYFLISKMLKKDFKKWARMCYQGCDIYKSFYKCKLISATLNVLYKNGRLTKDYFRDLISLINDLKVTSNENQYTYTQFETDFLKIYEKWFNAINKK